MEYVVKDTSLSAIGEAIREKTGKTEMITLLDMPGEIRGIEGGGISLSDNLVVPPKTPFEGYLYTVNSNGTVTVQPPESPEYPSVMLYFTQGIDSLLPMENGKTYKLTVTPSDDVKSVDAKLQLYFTHWGGGDYISESYFIDFKEGNSVTFTVPEYPWFLEYINVPALLDKSVTYTFDLREVLEKADNYEDGFEAGKKAEYDTFWDAFQENGERTDYRAAFFGWRKECYNPKYPIVVAGVSPDTFRGTTIESLGVIDCSRATNMNTFFFESRKLKTVEKWIISDIAISYNDAFNSCYALENITIGGTITKKISFGACKVLTKASIESIINVLSDTTMGLTVTISKTAKENAFTDEEWATLITTKPNWTISLA